MVRATLVSSAKCFEGFQKVYRHMSEKLKCEMNFSVYLPLQSAERKCPVLYFLSGMTATERTFIDKTGFQRFASKHGIIVVGPDTSPRGCNIEGEEDSWDFGASAGLGFMLMRQKKSGRLIIECIPMLLKSMGGHGALIVSLKNPEKYDSISAFAPICNPSNGLSGQKALTGYLGSDRNSWVDWDATLLAKIYNGPEIEILIDQGADDSFLEKDLMTQNFIHACKGTKIKPTLRMQQGYDHGYMFVSTFIGDHFNYHAKYLCQ